MPKAWLLRSASLYLLVLWVVASIPLASILWEFRDLPMCSGAAATTVGWEQARYYGSFFVYPPFIGPFLVMALACPLATALNKLRASIAGRRTRDKWFAYACIAILAFGIVVLSIMEFTGSPDAIFQIRPEDLASADGRVFLDRLKPFCEAADESLKNGFDAYQGQIARFLEHGTSRTSMWYHIGFVASAALHLTLFVTLAVFLFIGRENIPKWAICAPKSEQFLLGAAIFFGAVWCFFRLTYRVETYRIFASIPGFLGDLGIVGLYIFAFALFAMFIWLDLDRLAARTSVIINFTVWLIGCISISIPALGVVTDIFGSHTSVLNLVVLQLLILFLGFLSVAPMLRQGGG
jgi:hypothetical protein